MVEEIVERRKEMDGGLLLQSTRRRLKQVKEEEGPTSIFWKPLYGPIVTLQPMNLISDSDDEGENT
jgi:hypothetical protein